MADLTPLSEEQIASYFCEGYTVARGLVPREAVDAVVATVKDRAVEAGGRWQPTIFQHDDPAAAPATHAMLVEPHIAAAVGQILEAEPMVYYGMVAVVPPRGGTGLPWHQDNMYSQLLGRSLNAFVALCTITPEKANLWVAPGSHKAGVRDNHAAEAFGGHREADVDPPNGQCLPTLNPGDVCIFDRYTLHRSLRNETDQPRYAYAAQYCHPHTRNADDGQRVGRILARDLRELWATAPATAQ